MMKPKRERWRFGFSPPFSFDVLDFWLLNERLALGSLGFFAVLDRLLQLPLRVSSLDRAR
jgi:hypothetical protein